MPCTALHTLFRRSVGALTLVLCFATTSSAALRATVGSGNWSDPAVWQNAILPADSDDVVISAGTEVTVDQPTPALDSITVTGTLHGSTATIRLSGVLLGTGTWLPERSKVILIGAAGQTIGTTSLAQYYDLVLADSESVDASRVLDRNVTVLHDAVCQFHSDSERISGAGSLTVGHDFVYLGGSCTAWSGHVRFESLAAGGRDTSFLSAHAHAPSQATSFLFPPILVAKNDSSIVRLGRSRLSFDTLFTARADTILQVLSGSFDVQGGWISVTDPVPTTRPIIFVARRATFRVATPLPIYDGASPSQVFDSLHTPLFSLDSASTFEYYSYSSDVIDASYLANNLIDHHYTNLSVGSNAIVSLYANPITIRGQLNVHFGATIIPKHVKVFATGPEQQVITVFGDVVNDAPGPSGGAGFYGGILSSGTDKWVFTSDRQDGSKDTIHWTGPGQLGDVVVRPNVVLNVRRISDTLYDSLDIVHSLTEEAKPCGGHVIGTVYSEVPVTFSVDHPVDSMHGLGLVIDAGQNPYPTNVRVTRTSGYAPPGTDSTSNPVLRYYATYADGEAQVLPNHITAEYHCDELNGGRASDLNLWRSRERRGVWTYLGRSQPDSVAFSFSWSTSELYPVGTRRPYLWMFAHGYRDTPTPVELLSFSASEDQTGMQLSWTTASENDLLGFEVTRRNDSTEILVASWETDSSLRSLSPSGASYHVHDTPQNGRSEYRLYERTLAGNLSYLASRVVEYTPTTEQIAYRDGRLWLSAAAANSTVTIYDAAGRKFEEIPVGSALSVPLVLQPGLYLVMIRGASVERHVILAP